MAEDKEIKTENRMTNMEADIKYIKKTLEELPKKISEDLKSQINRVYLDIENRIEIVKLEALKQARRDDEEVFLKREGDEPLIEAVVCNVIKKEIGKWFLKSVLAQIFASIFISALVFYFGIKFLI